MLVAQIGASSVVGGLCCCEPRDGVPKQLLDGGIRITIRMKRAQKLHDQILLLVDWLAANCDLYRL